MANNLNPILYVEDDDNDVFLLQYGFRHANVREPLKVVTNGKDAVNYLSGTAQFTNRQDHPLPCLVLLDLNLPLLSGMEVLQWLRAESTLRELPVVILSSSEHPMDKQRAHTLGANDYLIKPTDPLQFVAIARQLKQRWLANFDGESPEVPKVIANEPTGSESDI